CASRSATPRSSASCSSGSPATEVARPPPTTSSPPPRTSPGAIWGRSCAASSAFDASSGSYTRKTRVKTAAGWSAAHHLGPQPRPDAGGTAGAGFGGVGRGGEAQAGVDAQPAQRLGLPRAAAVVHPREAHEARVGAGDEVGQCAAGEIRGSHTVAYVAARPGQAALAVEPDGGVPVARHAQRPAPPMGDGDVGERREPTRQRAADRPEDAVASLELGADR